MDTILIVDDTPDNLDILKGILKNSYKVKAANNGEKALRITSVESKPDLILLDIMMPVIDGFEVCHRLKENSSTKDIPVIFITALGDIESETKGLQMGAVDYITKPFNPSVVLARVATQLELLHQRRSIEKLLSKTLVGSIKILTDLLNALNKHASQISNKIRPEMIKIMKLANRSQLWRFEIASTLSHIGCVLIEPSILRKYSLGLLLSEKEKIDYEYYLSFGASLLKNIPRLEEISTMLKTQTYTLSNQEIQTPLSQFTDTFLGAQVLRTVSTFQYYLLMLDSESTAIERLKKENHHPDIIDLLQRQPLPQINKDHNHEIVNDTAEEVTYKADELEEGMVIAHNCETSWGMVVVPAGAHLTTAHITMLKNFCSKEKMNNNFVIVE